jgi:hypothetical protein
MYPFIYKEISRQKNVRIQVGVDVEAGLPKYDSQNKLSNVVQVAVPKGEYVVDKVFTEQFNIYGAKESTGKKDFYYDIKIPIQTSNTSAPLTPFSLSPNSDIKELTSVTESDNTNTNDTNVNPQTFLQKHKNHLLIVGALVIGYFAYKKLNK